MARLRRRRGGRGKLANFFGRPPSPPKEAGMGVGRSHVPLSRLGILPLTDTPGYSVQRLGSTTGRHERDRREVRQLLHREPSRDRDDRGRFLQDVGLPRGKVARTAPPIGLPAGSVTVSLSSKSSRNSPLPVISMMGTCQVTPPLDDVGTPMLPPNTPLTSATKKSSASRPPAPPRKT